MSLEKKGEEGDVFVLYTVAGKMKGRRVFWPAPTGEGRKGLG